MTNTTENLVALNFGMFMLVSMPTIIFTLNSLCFFPYKLVSHISRVTHERICTPILTEICDKPYIGSLW